MATSLPARGQKSAKHREYFLLVARHGPWEHSPFLPDAVQHLTQQGAKEVRDISKALAEHILLLPTNDQVRIGQIWHSRATYARDTATLFSDAIATMAPDGVSTVMLVPRQDLNPEAFWSRCRRCRGAHLHHLSRMICDALRGDDFASSGANALLLVGHQPLLGRIAQQFLGADVPLARSEVVCIRMNGATLESVRNVQHTRRSFWSTARRAVRPVVGPVGGLTIARYLGDRFRSRARRMLWSIEPTNAQVAEQLRAKIAAKIDVAKVLGTIITAVLALTAGQLLAQLLDPAKLKELTEDRAFAVAAVGSAALFMLAEVLYLSSIYAYDSLLMPSRFWAEGEGVGEAAWVPQRPPSSENYILYSNMLRIWNWLFTPATYALVGGLGLLAYAVVHRLFNFGNGDLLFLGGVLVLAAVFCVLKIQGEPHFGAQD